MKVVALISGGKDSCYNMMQCVQHGHEIVALANLKPSKQGELDSYMYQTVGHEAINLYAEAMGLPLYRRTIQGSSVELGKEYIKNDKDEVEDLYQLLLSIQSKIEFDAVSAGAILSDYQRVRVENVCGRLGLSSLAYLWRREQKELYEEMIGNGLVAIFIKVAVMGLVPRKHLGLKMVELHPLLSKLNSQFGLNLCGEGGEYETLTLDCPLFKKRIVIDESEVVIHSDDAFAEVGYLSLKAMHLEDKSNELPQKRLSAIMKELPIRYSGDSIENIPDNMPHKNEESSVNDSISISVESILERIDNTETILSNETSSYLWLTGLKGYQLDGLSVEEATRKIMDRLKDKLSSLNSSLNDVILMQLCIKNMNDFSRINSIYQQYFHVNPPARACLEANLDDDTFLQMDCLSYRPTNLPEEQHKSCEEISEPCGIERHCREAMHVQSISHWASANIGPYSQVIKVGPLLLISGCIGLWPSTMSIVEGGVAVQAALSLRHVDRIITALDPTKSLLHVFSGFGYVTRYQDIVIAEEAFKKAIQSKYFQTQPSCNDSHAVVCYVVVPYLPKGALVEYQMMAHSEHDQWEGFSSCVTSTKAALAFQGVCCQETRTRGGAVNCHIKPLSTAIIFREILTLYFQEHLKICSQYNLSMKDLLTMRIFYVKSAFTSITTNAIHSCVTSTLECEMDPVPAYSLLPVEGLKGQAVVMISCWFQPG